MERSLWCRLGRHRWKKVWNEEGQHYMKCERCGKEDDVASSSPTNPFRGY
jgi:hypothetical protein